MQVRSELYITSYCLNRKAIFTASSLHAMRLNDGKMVVLPLFLENVLLVIRLYCIYVL